MDCKYLENGMKVIYVHRPGNITSFSMGLDAGANAEKSNEIGIAHIVEHMVFKGTKSRNEFEINTQCDSVFGFNNAMTNFPYVIYYGTTLSQDFQKGLEIFSDIIINPTFPEEGFKEELKVICEELKEWKEDIYQCLEDSLYNNAFENRRIKELIIGSEEAIISTSLQSIKEFYNKNYCPENCVISIVSSESYEEVCSAVEAEFSDWKRKSFLKDDIIYEDNNTGLCIEQKSGIQGCKIQYCFPIHNLNQLQIASLKHLNFAFGEGTSSILYDALRTKLGLVYEVSSEIKNEKGIKLFNISLGTSFENINKALQEVENCIKKVKDKDFFIKMYNKESIKKSSKMLKLKQELKYEKSLILCNALTTYEIMYGDFTKVFSELEELDTITPKEVYEVACLVLNNPTIQILKPT